MIAAMLIVLFVALALTVPITVCISGAALVGLVFFYDNPAMISMLAQTTVTSADSFALMAIPFFMLVGGLMESSGLAGRLVDVAEALVGNIAGGLGFATVLAAMFFAAISGSGPAVVAALGAILVPAMAERGYSSAYAGALTASASTIGPVIPPSIPMVMYGVTMGVSVTEMFTGGFIPGVVMGLSLMIYNYIIAKKRGYGIRAKGAVPAEEKKSKGKVLWEAKWALLMPIIVLGGIYSGLCTPTESAVIGVVYSCIIGKFVYKTLTWQALKDNLLEAGLLSATVMVLLGGATTLGRIISLERVPQKVADAMMSVTDNKIIIMLIIMVILLIAGCFLDIISNIVLFAPLFAPLAVQMGYSPIFFGVWMCVLLCLGLLTPPLGMNLFVAQKVAGCKLEAIIKESVPTLIVLVIAAIIMLIFPQIVTFLPSTL